MFGFRSLVVGEPRGYVLPGKELKSEGKRLRRKLVLCWIPAFAGMTFGGYWVFGGLRWSTDDGGVGDRAFEMDYQVISLGLLWYIVFVGSVTFHEACHAFVGYRMGDRVGRLAGVVTLNPVVHIRRSRVGMIVVPIVSFAIWGGVMGWASVPYDRDWAMRYPKRSAMMSLAGPAGNLALVLVAAVLIHLGIFAGWFYAPEQISFTTVVVSYDAGIVRGFAGLLSIVFTLNLILCVFNMMPVPPLDGSGVLPVMFPDRSAREYMERMENPAFSMIGLIVVWYVFWRVFDPIHTFALNCLYPGSGYH